MLSPMALKVSSILSLDAIFAMAHPVQSTFSARGLDAASLTYITGYGINVQHTAAANTKF
jgi:hypothetical protein